MQIKGLQLRAIMIISMKHGRRHQMSRNVIQFLCLLDNKCTSYMYMSVNITSERHIAKLQVKHHS